MVVLRHVFKIRTKRPVYVNYRVLTFFQFVLLSERKERERERKNSMRRNLKILATFSDTKRVSRVVFTVAHKIHRLF